MMDDMRISSAEDKERLALDQKDIGQHQTQLRRTPQTENIRQPQTETGENPQAEEKEIGRNT
ncbi:putative G-protein coupled receptor [Sesbania bispinosa]|nr:putative G-protein coupled receptor [Sesbania bispinosa]